MTFFNILRISSLIFCADFHLSQDASGRVLGNQESALHAQTDHVNYKNQPYAAGVTVLILIATKLGLILSKKTPASPHCY